MRDLMEAIASHCRARWCCLRFPPPLLATAQARHFQMARCRSPPSQTSPPQVHAVGNRPRLISPWEKGDKLGTIIVDWRALKPSFRGRASSREPGNPATRPKTAGIPGLRARRARIPEMTGEFIAPAWSASSAQVRPNSPSPSASRVAQHRLAPKDIARCVRCGPPPPRGEDPSIPRWLPSPRPKPHQARRDRSARPSVERIDGSR